MGFMGYDVDFVVCFKCNGKLEKVIKQEILRKLILRWRVEDNLKRVKSRNREIIISYFSSLNNSLD